MAQPRHVGCSVCCLPGADCPRTASCVGSVSLSLWGRGDTAGPFMASQPRWSRTVGGPLDSEAPWLALRLRREYNFDNCDLGLKVRMGPGRKLPVGNPGNLNFPGLTVRAVQIGAPPWRSMRSLGGWKNKKSNRFAPIGTRLALYYSNFLRSTTWCIRSPDLVREVPHADTCGPQLPAWAQFWVDKVMGPGLPGPGARATVPTIHYLINAI